MKRIKLRKSADRRAFRKTSGQHPSNSTVRYVMRGGIRK